MIIIGTSLKCRTWFELLRFLFALFFLCNILYNCISLPLDVSVGVFLLLMMDCFVHFAGVGPFFFVHNPLTSWHAMDKHLSSIRVSLHHHRVHQ